MKKCFIATLIALVAICPLLKSADLAEFEKKEYKGANGKVLPYRILWPENMKKGEKYPVFLFIHGMGMIGTDNEKQLRLGGKLFLKPENRTNYPCIVLYPQSPGESFITIKSYGQPVKAGLTEYLKGNLDNKEPSIELSDYGDMVYQVLQQLIESGVVNDKRIYVAGSSMGAMTTYRLIYEHPELFAAAGPMSGPTMVNYVERWAGKVPVWIVQGDKDEIVPPKFNRDVVEKLKSLGIDNYRYDEHPNVGHGGWVKAFAEPDFMEWFFSHSRK